MTNRKYIVTKEIEIGFEILVPVNTVLTLEDNRLYLNNKLICHKNSVIGKQNVKIYSRKRELQEVVQ